MDASLRYKIINRFVPFSRFGLYFRFVTEEDYMFIFGLRNDKQRGIHLSKTDANPKSQILWIQEYKKRESSGDDLYFMTLDPDHNEKLGVVRLYNFCDNTFETGSWLFKSGLYNNQAILGYIAVNELAFDLLKYKKSRLEVRKENTLVVAFHRLFQPVCISEDPLNFYFELPKDNFERTKLRLLNLFWYKQNETEL